MKPVAMVGWSGSGRLDDLERTVAGRLDGGSAGILVLVLEHGDQVANGVGMVRLDHDVDGAVLHVDFG
ncbi:MAG: hypothetical protein JRM90_06225, partial [Nitrososphaerota archaeon]|nr:hypothetical protein [Nitrososphaerota archaeon]